MHTKQTIKNQIEKLGIKGTDTLLIHSSMKAIGEVENGADGVIDAFMEYMKDGLLVFPTHTWKQINDEYNVFDVKNEPSCVGILSNMFMGRPGVIRSWHPTHSVAAVGRDAAEYVSGEEKWETPCPRTGCWGKLYDREAKVLFIGCGLKNNTLLHGVEEWNDVPNRISDNYQYLKIQTPEGKVIERPSRRHFPGISANYDKIGEALFEKGIAKNGQIGDGKSIVCDVKGMTDLTTRFLTLDPDLFLNSRPVPINWYR